ncbi:MAG: class I SAM-dependent methyltransferase [Desulfobacterales bacterium]|nr:class I SAM-dependent methyltransferase [Desulfobacterales bacterium]
MHSTNKQVKEIQAKYPQIAIYAMLPYIYEFGMMAEPKFIVELGVSKEALANKVLEIVARRFNSDFISCDLYDFGSVCKYEKWIFVQSDDIRFGKFLLEDKDKVDLLFIDTDELYPHTKEEIETFFPRLNDPCTVMFRCTNLRKELVYQDGVKTHLGWDNQRGVIRAIEEYLEESFDESNQFQKVVKDWEVIHYPWGAGLTVLRRGYH